MCFTISSKDHIGLYVQQAWEAGCLPVVDEVKTSLSPRGMVEVFHLRSARFEHTLGGSLYASQAY